MNFLKNFLKWFAIYFVMMWLGFILVGSYVLVDGLKALNTPYHPWWFVISAVSTIVAIVFGLVFGMADTMKKGKQQ